MRRADRGAGRRRCRAAAQHAHDTFTLDDQLYTVAGYPSSEWARNSRAAGTGTLSRGRKSWRVKIIELSACAIIEASVAEH